MPTGIYIRKIIEETLDHKAKRFWSKVKKGPNCWQWTAHTTRDGYGRFSVGGMLRLSHRVSWELIKGKIPDGLVIDHICRNSGCVNPEHLETVTQKENVARGFSFSAINRRKIKCMRGHKFTKSNTYKIPGGGRQCIECRKDISRRYRLRKKIANQKEG